MFGFDPLTIAIPVLVALSIGAILYALFFNRIEEEKKGALRLQAVASRDVEAAAKANSKKEDTAKRRKQIGDAIGELEKQNKDTAKSVTKPPLKLLLKQAGLSTDIRTFYIMSIIAGIVAGIFAMIMSGMILVAIGVALVVGFGLPRWVVGYIRKRRMNKFLLEFPNALDVIVRAIKSGLPLNDGLRLIAAEAKEPVRTEFRRIVEAQQLGVPTPDACLRMFQTMPVQESNFFAVVIQIQQQAGGNLAEALGNLSGVLRARKSMKAKIAAMSMEAKASAYIIGSLPFIVSVLIHFTSPDYLVPLFITSTGHIILAVSAVWMAIGVFVMKQMINFEV